MVANVGNVFKRPLAEERKRLRKGRQKSISDGVQFMREFNAVDTARSFHDSPPRLSDAAAEKLVSVDEDETFQQPPLIVNVDGQYNANTPSKRKPNMEERKKERRRLRKSQSENVAAMRAMTNNDFSALDTSTSRQRRTIATIDANSSLQLSDPPQQGNMEKLTQRTGGDLYDHLARKEVSPIKSEEEDTQTSNIVDSDANALPKRDGSDNDDDQNEKPSKVIVSPPTILSMTSRDDFSIPSSRRISLEDTDAATLNGRTKAPETLDRKQVRRRRRNLRTQSEGVAFMRSSLADTDTDSVKPTTLAPVCELGGDSQLETLAGLAKLSTKDLPEIPPFEEKRRRSRLRSASDGVAAMAMGLVRDTDSSKSLALTGDNGALKQSPANALSVSNESGLPIGSTSDDVVVEEEEAKPNNRVSFAIFHSSSASKTLSSPTDRMSSIDSAASDDGDSDIDDVPDALQDDISVTPTKHIFSKPRIDLTSFLQSGKYPAASFLYGPMICLFLIG